MPGPWLVAVDDDPGVVGDLQRELDDRYGRHYQVKCCESSEEALAQLEELSGSEAQVALVLAGQWLPGMTGSDLLGEVRRLHPHARRGLVIAWGGWGQPATREAIFEAVADGRVDHYVLTPSAPPDELFHNAVSGFLLDWSEGQRSAAHTVKVVGESWSGRAYELRDTLGRCAIPHRFCLADTKEGRDLLARPDAKGRDLPMVFFPDGAILTNPTDAQMAEAGGSSIGPDRDEFDLVIVGAGPAGLSSAVYAASEGFSTLVVDQRGVGGQATSSSLIRNYLGFPRGVGGRRLAQHAYQQAWVFGASFAFMQRVTELQVEGDRLLLSLSSSDAVRASAVVLAMGAEYRRLGIPALEELTGAGVFYGGPGSEAIALAGREVYVVGGANSAGQAALHLARYTERVTLVVRAQSLRSGMSHYLVHQIEAAPNVDVRLSTEVVGGGGDGWLDHLMLRESGVAAEERVRADGLFLTIGASPHTSWLPPEVARDPGGFVLTGTDLDEGHGWPLERSPLLLETSVPRVLAAGDVRHGSSQRVASAVGEGSVAIQTLHSLLTDDRSPTRVDQELPAGASRP